MNVKAVLFDLGETLLHFGPVDRAALFYQGAQQSHEYLRGQGLRLPELPTYIKSQWRALRWASVKSVLSLREIDVLGICARMTQRIGLKLERAQLQEAMWAWYEPLARQARVESVLHQTLSWFKDNNIQMALVSNTFVPAATMDRHLVQLDLLDYFPTRVYSSEVTVRKPHPRIFRTALKQLNLSPSEVMFVGDRLRMDICGAKWSGMRTVWKRTRRGRFGQLFMPDFIIDSIDQLPAIVGRLTRASSHADRAVEKQSS